MKNLKKVLALVLVMASLFGIMTVASAKVNTSEKYTDKADISESRKTAVDIMTAIGVFNGTDNKLNPKGVLRRSEAAKIACYMLMGEEKAEQLKATVAPFTDVAADHWAAGYIGYCANIDILAGVGGGRFNPDGELTGLQFAKVMLVALGYDPKVEGLTGSKWGTNTAKLAIQTAEIAKDIDDLNAPVIREDACQIAYLTEKADMVYYQGGVDITNADGSTVTVGATRHLMNASGAEVYNGDNDSVLQFCERYCSKLKVTTATDSMKRPAKQWAYKGETIGTYSEDVSFTEVVSKVKSDGATHYTIAEYVTDVMKKSNWKYNPAVNVNFNGVSGTTGSPLPVGSIVEFFMNENDVLQVDYIAVTTYKAAKLTGDAVTKTTGDLVEVRVPGVVGSYTDVNNVKGYEGLKKDDVVYYSTGKSGTTTTYKIAKADSFEGKLTGKGNSSGTKLLIGGTTYEVNHNVGKVKDTWGTSETPVYNTTYKYYTDNNGFVVYAEAVEDESSDYVVMQTIGPVAASGVTTNPYAQARLVFMDGTTKVVTVSKINDGTNEMTNTYAGSNVATSILYNNAGTATLTTEAGDARNVKFFTYKIVDGEYELKAVSVGGTTNRTSGNMTGYIVNGGASIKDALDAAQVGVDDKTVFIIANKASGATAFTTYTGKGNVPNVSKSTKGAKITWIAKGGVATYVYVYSYDAGEKTGGGDTVYLLSSTGSKFEEIKKADNSTQNIATVKAVIDHKLTDVKIRASAINAWDLSTTARNSDFLEGVLGEPTYDTETGAVTDINLLTAQYNAIGYGYKFENGTLTVNGITPGSYSCSTDVPAFYKDEDDNYNEMTMAEFTEDGNDAIYVVVDKNDAGKVDFVYIKHQDDSKLTYELQKDTNNSYADNGRNALSKDDATTVNTDFKVTGVSNTNYVWVVSDYYLDSVKINTSNNFSSSASPTTLSAPVYNTNVAGKFTYVTSALSTGTYFMQLTTTGGAVEVIEISVTP